MVPYAAARIHSARAASERHAVLCGAAGAFGDAVRADAGGGGGGGGGAAAAGASSSASAEGGEGRARGERHKASNGWARDRAIAKKLTSVAHTGAASGRPTPSV